MDDRMHRALDGELELGELTAAEAAAVARAEAEFLAIRRAIRVDPLPDLAPVVMRRIAQSKERDVFGLRAWLDGIWTPRQMTITWRPAYAAAAVLVMAVSALLGRWTAPPKEASPLVFTTFVLEAPDASEVALAGDFTNWEPSYRLTRAAPGVWTVVVPLEPGIHDYAFVVNGGQWVPDPNAPAFEDGFGGLNSRIAVITPDRAEL